MRLCSYVVKIDSGFAPNPFWGFCTLAACTPNHQGLQLAEGDWILGNSSTDTDRRIIYAMRVSEVLDFDDYYHDERFSAKKASTNGWRERCGDNIYFRDEDDEWAQGIAVKHTSQESIEQDTRNPRVFVSDHFFYFGENAPEMPLAYRSLLQTRQGCKYHRGEVVSAFVDWLEKTYSPGILGEPRDRDEESSRKCEIVQDKCERPESNRSTCQPNNNRHSCEETD